MYDALVFDTVGVTKQNHWNMKYRLQWPTKKYELTRSVRLNKYPKYDAYQLDRAEI